MLFSRIYLHSNHFQPFIKVGKQTITSFATAMAEALEKHNNEKEEKIKSYKSRYNPRLRKRQWEESRDSTGENNECSAEKKANFERIKRKKCAVLLGYSGVNYFGMQRNPGMKTIEEDFLNAMLKNEWITEEAFNQPQLIQFQRAARTDKGVSAARQCCSIKLPEDVDIEKINLDLPDQIRVFAVKRVTKGFNSKDQCNARTYTYTLPTIAFAHDVNEIDMVTYRVSTEKLNELNEILKLYEGTKNFHNFTSRKEFLDPSSKRYIMSFTCEQPFICPNRIEFVTIRIKGQSFMLHQIRKMVGLTLAILKKCTTRETILRAFTEERLDIPMAPGLGLVLDTVHYDNYNSRYGEDGIHEPLNWEKEELQIQSFIKKYIYPTIYETEIKEKSMVKWLETLNFHSYDVRENDKEQKEEKSNVLDNDAE